MKSEPLSNQPFPIYFPRDVVGFKELVNYFVCVGACGCHGSCVGQGTTCGSCSSASTMSPGSPTSVASTFIHRVRAPVLDVEFQTLCLTRFGILDFLFNWNICGFVCACVCVFCLLLITYICYPPVVIICHLICSVYEQPVFWPIL